MELFVCPECNHSYRDNVAGSCPKCGYNVELKKSVDDCKHKRNMYLIGSIFFGILTFVIVQQWDNDIIFYGIVVLDILAIIGMVASFAENQKVLKILENRLNEYHVQIGKDNYENISKNQEARSKKKRIAIPVVCIVAVLLIGSFVYFNSVGYKIKVVCSNYGLSNVKVKVSSDFVYEGYTFYSVDIVCDGFSKLDEGAMHNVFAYTDNAAIGKKKIVLSKDDITIKSDGHIYTYTEDTSGSTNYFKILCDGIAVATKTTIDNNSPNYDFSDYSTDSDDKYGHTKYDVIVIAKNKVKEYLKSPSTAEFCSSSNYSVTRTGTTWTVIGYVDAQNSFGAVCRSYFTVVITFSSRDYYSIDSCVLDE